MDLDLVPLRWTSPRGTSTGHLVGVGWALGHDEMPDRCDGGRHHHGWSHEDGLDSAGALGGGYDRAAVLRILKDRRFRCPRTDLVLMLKLSLLVDLGTMAPAGFSWVSPLSGRSGHAVGCVPYARRDELNPNHEMLPARVGFKP